MKNLNPSLRKRNYRLVRNIVPVRALLLALLILFSSNLFALDYYWVGGTGNWSEFGTHWATTSGGVIMHTQEPTSADDVFFDANSFPLPLSMMSIDVMAYCNNMDWTGVTNMPNMDGFSTLYISGSLTLDPNMTASYSSQVVCESSQPGNTINFAGVALSIWEVQFAGSGDWTLMSDIDLSLGGGQFTVNQGTVNTNDFTISVSSFQTWPGGGQREINLGNSVYVSKPI